MNYGHQKYLYDRTCITQIDCKGWGTVQCQTDSLPEKIPSLPVHNKDPAKDCQPQLRSRPMQARVARATVDESELISPELVTQLKVDIRK